MAVSPHPAATEAGADVLRAGGNAIDAAVAIGAALAVVFPHFCGIGGDAVWLVSDAEGDVDCFLGQGQAIAACPPCGGGPIPVRGPGSALTTAGAVDSWQHALDHAKEHWGGQGRLSDLLAPGIRLAEEGFPVTPSQCHWLTQRRDEIASWPGFSRTYLPSGRAPTAGERFVQEALSGSLKAIARDGARSFYEGDLADRIIRGLSQNDVPMTLSDLAATRTDTVQPLELTYRDVVLYAPPPPTQGLSTLTTMGVLQRFDVGALLEGSADDIHLVVEAIKQAFLYRHRLADPRVVPVDTSGIGDPEHLDGLAADIDMTRAMPWPQTLRHGDTVFFGAFDGQGRGASVLQSIYYDWGSGVVAGDTGILWHNRGAAFSTVPGDPNALAPGKRPFLTLNPGLATRAGRPYLLYGTQGADGQPQTLALLLTRLLDFGLAPAEALHRPRFLLGKTFSDSRDSLKLEEDVGKTVQRDLAKRGHEVVPIEAQSPLAGLAGVIRRNNDGRIEGSHDPRGDGAALLVEPTSAGRGQ